MLLFRIKSKSANKREGNHEGESDLFHVDTPLALMLFVCRRAPERPQMNGAMKRPQVSGKQKIIRNAINNRSGSGVLASLGDCPAGGAGKGPFLPKCDGRQSLADARFFRSRFLEDRFPEDHGPPVGGVVNFSTPEGVMPTAKSSIRSTYDIHPSLRMYQGSLT